MTKDSLEPIGPKEQRKAQIHSAPESSAFHRAPNVGRTELAEDYAAPSKARRPSPPGNTGPQTPKSEPLDLRVLGFAVAFVVGAVATFLILSAVAFGFTGQYNTRVLPGVHVGSVDLSGMTHDEAIAELKSSYAYLGQGEVTLTTPVGATTITYQQVDRGPDVEAMVDAAMAVGHTGSSIEDAAIMIHTAVLGQDIPVAAQASGGVYHYKDGRTAPDTINVLLEYQGRRLQHDAGGSGQRDR